MDEKALVEMMIRSVDTVPAEVDVLQLRQISIDELEKRALLFLNTAGEAFNLPLVGGDWISQKERTLIRLPLGARMVVYHASGAMRLVTGLNPMESLFKSAEDRDRLVKLVEDSAERLRIRDLVADNGTLRFERLWQIKAAAADRDNKAAEPVLCRAVGTYRHVVGELPVWGAASLALKIAGDGALDSVDVQVRATTSEVIERAKVLPPELAARQILQQLSTLVSRSKVSVNDLATPQWMRFGYFSLSKRKGQRLLAPVYASAIELNGRDERQPYLFVVPASEKLYLPLDLQGSEALATRERVVG